jgi:hypothetical protein
MVESSPPLIATKTRPLDFFINMMQIYGP